LDVLGLCALVSPAQQDDDGLASFLEINAEAWAVVDPQFAGALSYRPYIPGIPKGKAIKARRNQCAYPLVLEPYPPSSEGLGLFKLHLYDLRSL
jgi:hypothetical protein